MSTQIFNLADLTPAAMAALARELAGGAVAVFPTDTVYGIGTGALCEKSIQRIYQIKQRPAEQPLQVLAGSLEQARKWAVFSKRAEKLAQAFWGGALTLILPPTPDGKPLARSAAGIGIRVPNDPFLKKLLSSPLASTSANLHGQPVLTDETKLEDTFSSKVDIIIKAGTLSPTASSVVDLTQDDSPRLLREGALAKQALEQVLKIPFV